MIFAGIDAGSRAIKVALWDGDTHSWIGRGLRDQGVRQEALIQSLLQDLLAEQGLAPEDIGRMVATGYGRAKVRFADAAVTEITCHAVGVYHLCPGTRMVIDIGGQDSKVIWLSEEGRVMDFVMNDRCAAGTGRFLEMVARRLEMDLLELGRAAEASTCPAAISSTCAVFAETEIVGLLADEHQPADIAAGVQQSVAVRIAAMAGRRVQAPVVFTGGVCRVPGMPGQVQAAIQHELTVAPYAQFTGALGAALLASRQA